MGTEGASTPKQADQPQRRYPADWVMLIEQYARDLKAVGGIATSGVRVPAQTKLAAELAQAAAGLIAALQNA